MMTVHLDHHPSRFGQPVAIVMDESRVVAGASLALVEWMHDHSPLEELDEAQRALVIWYDQTQTQAA